MVIFHSYVSLPEGNNLTTTEAWNDGFYSGNYPNMGIVLLFYELLFFVPRLLVSK